MHIAFAYDGYEHLGLGYLASVAMAKGHSVTLVPVDCGDYIRGHTIAGAKSIEKAVAQVMRVQPDVAAFSLNSFTAFDYCRMASALRKKGIKTLAGGPHATAEPVLSIQTNAFDGLIQSEAEEVFAEAVEFVANCSGAAPEWLYTENHLKGGLPRFSEIDQLPFPAKQLFYEKAPFEAKDYKIITSRGCPFHCSFCAHVPIPGKPAIRRRNTGNIINELLWAKKLYQPSTIYFLDDIFTLDLEWLRTFLREYKEQIGIPFHAISHPQFLNEEVAVLLRAARCFKVRMGVQSLTPQSRTLLGRHEWNAQVADAIAAARRCEISVEVDHMVNVPDETTEDARKGILFYNQNRPDAIKVYWLTPLPGTTWFVKAQERGFLSEATAADIRLGKGFGKHSYLFYGEQEYYQRRWLGIHFMLAFLPFLPRFLVTFLVHIHADRFLRIPSFLLLVGLPRFFLAMKRGDRVGRGHLERLWYRYTQKLKRADILA
jgi:anaerobic magnesium-protoporphyrin IX monomethyl ester cyclase